MITSLGSPCNCWERQSSDSAVNSMVWLIQFHHLNSGSLVEADGLNHHQIKPHLLIRSGAVDTHILSCSEQ